jgi:hypothetical protein
MPCFLDPNRLIAPIGFALVYFFLKKVFGFKPSVQFMASTL